MSAVFLRHSDEFDSRSGQGGVSPTPPLMTVGDAQITIDPTQTSDQVRQIHAALVEDARRYLEALADYARALEAHEASADAEVAS